MRIIQHMKSLVSATPTLTASLLKARIALDIGLTVGTTYIKSVLAAADWTYDHIFRSLLLRALSDSFPPLFSVLDGRCLKQNRLTSTIWRI